MNSSRATSYRMPSGFRVSAFLAWVLGFIVCRIVVANQAAVPIPSSIAGMIAGFLLYIILSKLLDRKKETDEIFTISSES